MQKVDLVTTCANSKCASNDMLPGDQGVIFSVSLTSGVQARWSQQRALPASFKQLHLSARWATAAMDSEFHGKNAARHRLTQLQAQSWLAVVPGLQASVQEGQILLLGIAACSASGIYVLGSVPDGGPKSLLNGIMICHKDGLEADNLPQARYVALLLYHNSGCSCSRDSFSRL